jgi:hypothetical protein
MQSRESKPSWSELPSELIAQVSELLRSPIVAADVAWAGFTPSATFVIRTGNGRKFFCKGTHPGLNDAGKKAFVRESAIYKGLTELGAFGPAFIGAAEHGEWQMLVLDFVERTHDVPPWTDETFRVAIEMLARFHRSMPSHARTILDDAENSSLATGLYAARPGWRQLAESEQDRDGLLALFAERAAASKWLYRNLDDFVALETQAKNLDGPRSWIHLDVRSDNLIFTNRREPILVDWPFLSYGSVLLDVAFFLPSVAGEGGPPPQGGLAVYEDAARTRFDDHHVRVTAALVAGFFAARAGRHRFPVCRASDGCRRCSSFRASIG